jgi:hypothetical protein
MLTAPWSAAAITLMSLNLHAYHPMGEAPRFLQDQTGKIEKANPDLFFFQLDEVARGSERRAQALAKDLARAAPDWVFFQEVAAGDPTAPKTCDTFYHSPENAAKRIAQLTQQNGKSYQLYLACRGNRGWWTDPTTFQKQRVLREGPGGYEVVYDFGANPFPDGMIVEGYAALIDPKWQVLDYHVDFVQANPASDRGLVQLFTMKRAGDPSGEWFMIANVHLANKLGNFEQSVAAREYLAAREAEARRKFGGAIEAGFFVMGDYNSLVYRPHSTPEVAALPRGEISSVPWEFRVSGQFDFSPPLNDSIWNTVAHELTDLNFNANYKPDNTVTDLNAVKARVRDIVERYSGLAARGAYALNDGLTQMLQGKASCLDTQKAVGIPFVCTHPKMIDHLYYNTRWTLHGGAVLYPQDQYDSADGISDHPGILFQFVH